MLLNHLKGAGAAILLYQKCFTAILFTILFVCGFIVYAVPAVNKRSLFNISTLFNFNISISIRISTGSFPASFQTGNHNY